MANLPSPDNTFRPIESVAPKSIKSRIKPSRIASDDANKSAGVESREPGVENRTASDGANKGVAPVRTALADEVKHIVPGDTDDVYALKNVDVRGSQQQSSASAPTASAGSTSTGSASVAAAKVAAAKTSAAKVAKVSAVVTSPRDLKARQKPLKQFALKQRDADDEADEEEEGDGVVLRRTVPAWLASAAMHLLIILVLGLIMMPQEIKQNFNLVASPPLEIEELIEEVEVEPEPMDIVPTDIEAIEPSDDVQTNVQIEAVTSLSNTSEMQMDLAKLGMDDVRPMVVASEFGTANMALVNTRGETARRASVMARGGTPASEAAVARALKWLAEHQNSDGSWSFDHTHSGSCNGQCDGAGELIDTKIAATGFALLPFLGAGQTHRSGKYQDTVLLGLKYLSSRIEKGPNGGALLEPEGRMYGHGVASIALCEAYAMTREPDLIEGVQDVVDFICYAQDPVGGGWRYGPRQPGDTSVVGWQLMALISAKMTYVPVPQEVIDKSRKFLDSVQFDNGSGYGYVDGTERGGATSAIGLLCRMYLGWKHDHPMLQKGVKILSDQGPSKNNLYHNYYATQVLHHYDGPLWEKWNEVMRDQLVESQATTGHEKGSWYDGTGHGAKGGRLYCTAMSTMILEVYYRHMPIYAKSSTGDVFGQGGGDEEKKDTAEKK